MKNLAKPPHVGSASAVRQMKGPGMNLGLKKPRTAHIAKPKPYAEPRAMKKATGGQAQSNSYLPMLAGGGKVTSCKQY